MVEEWNATSQREWKLYRKPTSILTVTQTFHQWILFCINFITYVLLFKNWSPINSHKGCFQKAHGNRMTQLELYCTVIDSPDFGISFLSLLFCSFLKRCKFYYCRVFLTCLEKNITLVITKKMSSGYRRVNPLLSRLLPMAVIWEVSPNRCQSHWPN